MWLGELDFGWVSLASPLVLFHLTVPCRGRVNVVKGNFLTVWDLGWRMDGKEWKS